MAGTNEQSPTLDATGATQPNAEVVALPVVPQPEVLYMGERVMTVYPPKHVPSADVRWPQIQAEEAAKDEGAA